MSRRSTWPAPLPLTRGALLGFALGGLAACGGGDPSSASTGTSTGTSASTQTGATGAGQSGAQADAAPVQTILPTSGAASGASSGSLSSGSGVVDSGRDGGSDSNDSSTGGVPVGDAASGVSEGGTSSGDSGPPVVDLFNGTDLTGWSIATGWPTGVNLPPLAPADAQKIFQVEGGMIHDYKDAVDMSSQPKATLMTNASYGNYTLWVEYKWGTKKFAPYAARPRDAGILFHVSGDRTAVWPSSIEFQILEQQTGDLWVLGSKCTSTTKAGAPRVADASGNLSNLFLDATLGGTSVAFDGTTGGYKQLQRSAPFDSLTDWNKLVLTVTADSAVYVVNGQTVNKVFNIQDKGGKPVTSGPIALQAEYDEVFYRNVRIQVKP